jgi:VIT1/CCC1 family predicted Fe2+/Mn2+ transporter
MQREALLDPIDRVSEILFGLIMAVTIVGSASIASTSATPGRVATIAALGCNLAWGLVDAVMYLLRTATERSRLRSLGYRVIQSDRDAAREIIKTTLPDHVRAIVGDAEIEVMRSRIHSLPANGRRTLEPRDFLEALGIFLLVVIATFPVVLPFLLLRSTPLALLSSRVIAIGMLFILGFALGRYAGYRVPLYTGLAMAALGVALIAAVIALGG